MACNQDSPEDFSQQAPEATIGTKTFHRFKTQPINFRSLSGTSALRPQRQNSDSYIIFETKSPRVQQSFNSRSKSNAAPRQNTLTRQETNVSAGRYLDALKGPELEVLKDSEDLLLPTDQTWPFLLRFPISTFGIVLGLGSQTILWKKLTESSSMEFLHIPPLINLVLWFVCLCVLVVISVTYTLKCIFYFEAVLREYYHPFRINFFFSPWICGMFLTLGIPPSIAATIHPAPFFIFMAPILLLELKIYGQWLSGGERRLSKVANPASHLSIVGNFVGSVLGATLGWRELAIFFWSVGIIHYLILLVTLYQRLPTNELLTRDMHPVYFLFLAVPSTASVAMEKITGEFGLLSRIIYFLAVFLFLSLVVRINLFRGCKFSMAWWAYTFPLTAVALASIQYSEAVFNSFTRAFAAGISFVAISVVSLLLGFTLLHALVWRSLFPNDMAIAITRKKRKVKKKKLPTNCDGAEEEALKSAENGSCKPLEPLNRTRTVTFSSEGCK